MSTILDSGARREFGTGAVRDIQEGKGRCDLMPLGVVAKLLNSPILYDIDAYQASGEPRHLASALNYFAEVALDDTTPALLLEVSKHFEDGAKKYGENNWQKGIPTHCYIDSAVRHYLKWMRGDTDEPHDRAFAWNLLCCMWTCEHMPELNEYAKETEETDHD